MEVKERPILFSGPMVRAILDGKKTQTRRVVKPMSRDQATWLTPTLISSVPHGEMINGGWQMHHPKADTMHMGVYVSYDSPLGWINCPYGQPGDLLWVRETFALRGCTNGGGSACVQYKADDQESFPYAIDDLRWKPSIHMPRLASRLTLRITDVRVQRVREISEDDAIAEGIVRLTKDGNLMKYSWYTEGDTAYHAWRAMPRSAPDAFHELWDSINDKRGFGWGVNPWVWALSFEVVSPSR